MFFHLCCGAVRSYGSVWGGGDSSGVHADPFNPIYVLLGFNPANGQAKVMSGCCGTTENFNTCNVWSGILMLKHSTIDAHVRNNVMLQDLVSISDACQYTCHLHKSRPTTMVDSCTHHDTATTKTTDLLHAV